MLAQIGSVLTALALTAALYAAFAIYWSIRRDDLRWAASGRNAVYAAAGLLGLAVLVLLAAFLDDQFYIRYVAQHSSRALPFYLKASAVWGGQAGSLLLWSFLQALFAALLVWHPPRQGRVLIPWATVFLSLITVFFTAVTLFLSNPFAMATTVPADGQGLNPLLRHPGMIFHPPAMYLGYVGLAVPFALALAAVVVRRVDDWPAAARRWTLAAWLFLGLGLLLGMRWAYDVLGWGGYWGWDPVENAGLMPWLTATALLHGLVMQDQRRGFRWWNLLLVLLSFVLVLFGTFTTRSGLIQSVHAFARSNLGLYFLGAIALTLLGSLALFFTRRSLLTDDEATDDLFSREGMFILTLILFLTITVSVFVGSTLPTLTGGTFEAPPAWFDRVTGPQFAALVLVMGLCPLLGRAVNALRQLERRGFSALLGSVLVTGIAVLVGFTRPASLIGFAIVGLAGGTALGEISRALAARVRKGEGPAQALWRLFGRNHRRYGGYLVHLGVILMAVGVIGTRFYPFETEIVIAPGESITVGDYALVFEDLKQESASDHVSTRASLAVYRGDKHLRTLYPQLDNYQDFHQTIAIPAVRAGVREDLYLILAGWSDGGTSATFKVFINPLAMFLWLGGLVFMAGGAVALWPSLDEARLSAPQMRRRRVWSVLGLGVGVVLLALAVWAMWGTGQGTAAPAPDSGAQLAQSQSSRVREGEPAPGFALDLLDESTLDLADLRGEVVVLNFWATWCPPCEDELPDFQSVWEDYRQRNVVFVGLTIQEDMAEVEEMLARLGVTYPVGLDAQQQIALEYGITGVPETFVIDPQGDVASVHIGPVSAGQLRQDLDNLLE